MNLPRQDASRAALTMTAPRVGAVSPDGYYYWDGVQWKSSLSPDGRWWWNGVAWVGIAQSRTEVRQPASYNSMRTLGAWVCVLLGISIAVAVIESLMFRFYFADTLTFGDMQVEYSVGIAGVLVLVVTASLVVFWLWRSHRNLPALGAQDLQFTAGWAVGWWFVPIACFWMPYRAVMEIWKASDPLAASTTSADSRRQVAPSLVVRMWWASWLVSVVLSNVVAVVVTPDRNALDLLQVLSGATTVLAAVLTICVVRSVTNRQDERWRRLASIVPAQLTAANELDGGINSPVEPLGRNREIEI